MKELEKNEIKSILTDLVKQSEKIKKTFTKMETDYFGDELTLANIDDSVLDEKLNKFFNFINDDYELKSLLYDFEQNLKAIS